MRIHLHATATTSAAALLSVALAAQAPLAIPATPQTPDRLAFDVVSIKPHDDSADSAFSVSSRTTTGRYSASNVNVTSLILTAFRKPGVSIKANEILNVPSDIGSFRFDIVATTERTQQTMTAQMPALMRSLLEDRFKMVAHVETRTLPVYALVKARSDGRLGPQLRAISSDCLAQASPSTASPAPARLLPNCNSMSMGPTKMTLRGTTVSALTAGLPVDRPVIDETGITGLFDVDLEWAPISSGAPTSDGPSIFTALQEQLGLKLEPRQAPRDVIVVDHIEKPAPN